MKALLLEFRPALIATLLLTVLLCGLYPATVWGLAQLLFPKQANGSLVIDKHGSIIGSERIAQPFTADIYFHPRPSAAGAGYDATSSGGSNLGPLSRKLYEQIADRVTNYRRENSLPESAQVPADAVTASASGLDPDISVANARIQAGRVAHARAISVDQVNSFIAMYTRPRSLGILGEPGVNVLLLNLALDNQK